MLVKKKRRKTFEQALASSGRLIDPYQTMGDIGDPISDIIGNVKGQMVELRTGLTLAAVASTAAAVGVVLLLVTMPRGKR
jgi:hypothetical protein